MVQQQKERLTQIETAIRSVLYSVKVEHDVNWAVIFQVMNLYQEGVMPADDTLNQYLNNEEKERMLSISYDQQSEEQWLALIQDIRSNLHELPTSNVAQQLLDRWLEGTYEMYGEDEQFLGKTWDMIANESESILFYPMTKEVVEFITAAMHVRDKPHHQL